MTFMPVVVTQPGAAAECNAGDTVLAGHRENSCKRFLWGWDTKNAAVPMQGMAVAADQRRRSAPIWAVQPKSMSVQSWWFGRRRMLPGLTSRWA